MCLALCHYSVAEGEGFEPSKPFDLHTFQACSFDHSDTPPQFLALPWGLRLPRQNGAYFIEIGLRLQATRQIFPIASGQYRIVAACGEAQGVAAEELLHQHKAALAAAGEAFGQGRRP